ncbi:MAG: PqqD family peptide modification chaperone [Desulfobacterales bacterium]|nr:PqqD family peptide modification chaperone [Desulfobacterales bacterium]
MSQFIIKKINNELMFYDTKMNKVHILNESAQLIYNLYIKEKSLEDIENEISNNFQIEENYKTIHYDIEKCIGIMKEKGLII